MKSSANAVEEERAIGSAGANTVGALREMALRGLPRMFCQQEGIYYFRLRRSGNGIVEEGLSPRYTAISVIGLANVTEREAVAATCGNGLQSVCLRLEKRLDGTNNLGDVALSLWGAKRIGFPDLGRFWRKLMALDPVHQAHPVVELSWALDAACADAKAADAPAILEKLSRRIMDSFSPRSAVFPHVLGASGARAHVSCFADMVYPIHALANFGKLCGDKRAVEIAAEAARKICDLQGEAGQWWWHYDQRTGDVVEGYPVYAIHQDAMGPMALFALKDAGGPDHTKEIRRGLEWLYFSPEIQGTLIDTRADLIWRKVARREPNKLTRYVQAAASRIHPAARVPGVDSVFPPRAIDFEDRPYHLGWLLHAWPAARAKQWDAAVVNHE